MCMLVNMLHDRLCETEVRSRGDGGLVPDLSRKAGGGKTQTLRFVIYEGGGKRYPKLVLRNF